MSYRAERLSGDVAITAPASWQAIGYLLFGCVASAAAFLSIATYARVETATGTIVPDAGIAAIVPPRSGLVSSLLVHDGDFVAARAELASIRVEEDGPAGLSASARLEAAIARQDSNLAAQLEATSSAIVSQSTQVAAQREGLIAEIEQIRSQVELQHQLISSARDDLDRGRTIAERGFISRRDLQAREETLVARQQGLAQLAQNLAARRSALLEAERRNAELAAVKRAQAAGLAAARAEVAQQAESLAGSRSYVLRAPVAGRVTALTARVGQTAGPQAALMMIVPAGSVLQAELAVPSSAIGFVKVGQPVRLALDAFPYQRFGTVDGKVLTVSASAIAQAGPGGTTMAVYPVTVALEAQAVEAYGREEALVPAMSLTARIVTENQSLLEWLFAPLFAVRQR